MAKIADMDEKLKLLESEVFKMLWLISGYLTANLWLING
jgi:hypothetical protein